MQTKSLIKVGIFLLVFLGVAIDLYTTLRHPNFLQLESNPSFILIKGVWSMFAIKLLLLFIVYLVLFKTRKIARNNTGRFFYITLIIIVIILQIYAGYNNHNVKKSIAENFNHSQIDEVTYEEIQSIAPSKDEMIKTYFLMMGIFIVYPLLVSMLSFITHKYLF